MKTAQQELQEYLLQKAGLISELEMMVLKEKINAFVKEREKDTAVDFAQYASMKKPFTKQHLRDLYQEWESKQSKQYLK